MDPINRAYFKIFYVIQGKTTMWIDEKNPVLLNEKELMAVPKGITHRLRDAAGREATSIYILSIQDKAFARDSDEKRLLNSLNTDHRLASLKFSSVFEEFADMAALLRKLKHEEQNRLHHHEMIVRNTVASLLARLERAMKRRAAQPARNETGLSSKARVKSIQHYIGLNFFEPLTVTQLADLCGLSVNRFTDLFKAVAKITPLQYIHKKRVEYAKARLKKSQDEIPAICFDAGFNDLSFFYRVFKKHTGKSPLAFRQRQRR